ncbi:MAG TPA: hypothetical protein ENK57_19285 [Polyangiaceae bacterium]|nr:hypothetical protein [Polyangiaceae bacterium]
MPRAPRIASCVIALAVFGVSSDALADAATWFHSGGGAIAFKDGPDQDLAVAPTLAFDLGVGTSTQNDFIFGGYFRVFPLLGEGADLAWMARFANQGFQKGWIGFAVDAGLYQRWWGIGSTGFMGQAVLGGPFGLQLAAIGTVGSNRSWGVGGTLGLDLVRLVVDREHSLNWWSNPRPSDVMYETSGRAPHETTLMRW